MFLEIEQLRKSYGTGENKVEVLKGIQLGVEKGKICVLLGPVSYTHLRAHET